MDTKTDWFTAWFNTTYYHILYKNRNDEDAQFFMRNLTGFLALEKNAHILDLPCGKGRHAVYLNSLGYTITGFDLSKNSIIYAKKFENETLNFDVHDMRKPLKNKYDAIFNLFTSFGYFDDDEEDIAILKNIKNGLNKEGVAVIDFLNVEKVKANLVKEEVKTIDNIDFYLKREIKNGFICKHISFLADGKQHEYTERVKYLDNAKMNLFIQKAGLEIMHTFGNYQLDSFNAENSDRLILVVK